MKNERNIAPKILAALITATSVFSAIADERDAKRCAELIAPSQRLACFDAMFPRPSGSGQHRYRELALRDLLLHIPDIGGQEIEVSGYLMTIDGIVGSLGERKFSKDGVLVSYDSVPPDQQKKLLEECEKGCRATVRGKANSRTKATIDVDAYEVKFVNASFD